MRIMSEIIPSPESFFGFQLGSDRNIARWDRIVEYFDLLNSHSENIQVNNMGPTTEGNPFLLRPFCREIMKSQDLRISKSTCSRKGASNLPRHW